MYGPNGWTKQLLNKLEKLRVLQTSAGYIGLARFKSLKATDLLALLEYIPTSNLSDRQNESPSIEDFVRIAAQFPSSTFIGYVVPMIGDDERFTIEGGVFPLEAVEPLIKMALALPDEDDEEYKADKSYRRLWWD